MKHTVINETQSPTGFRDKLINNKILQFKLLFLITFLINILIVSFWLLNNKFFQVHDFTTGSRIFELDNTLKNGQFPPRWSANFGFGYGMPLFEFYAPLSFMVAEVFHFVGIAILPSFKIGFILATVIGWLGSYLLGKKLTNQWGGLITATAFTLAPYHAVNLYVRGAYGEYFALSFLPWTLYFALQLIKTNGGKALNYLGLTLSLVGVLLSHNVTVVTYMPFWVLCLIGFIIIEKAYRKIPVLVLSLFNALAIAAFFLVPAFVQKNYTRADTLTEGFSQFQLHFLYFRQLLYPNWKYGGSVYGPFDDMSFYLGNDILAVAVVGIGLALYFWFKNNKDQKHQKVIGTILLLGLAFLGSIFATNFKAYAIWQHLPLVNFIQFPWRFLGVASFFLGFVSRIFCLYE